MSELYVVRPGVTFDGDWYAHPVPANILVGDDVRTDSAFCFKMFRSTQPNGLKIGHRVTIWRTSLATDPDATITIGDETYLANASLVAAESISIGNRVMVSLGVTIADSDFHPLEPAARLVDSVALSPIGNRKDRSKVTAKPVCIEDDVWLGANAVVLKGVRIGRGSVVQPGAVVLRDVPEFSIVAGNPGAVIGEVER